MPLPASKNKLTASCKKLFTFCSFLFLCLLLSTAANAAPRLSIGNGFEQANLQPFLDILLDNQQQYSTEALNQPPLQYQFTPLQNSKPENQKRLWLRFSVHNNSNQAQHLWLNFSSLKYKSLAVYKAYQQNTPLRLSLLKPGNQPSQLVNLKPNEQALFYLRLDDSPIEFKGLALMSSASYAQHLAKASQWKNASLSGLLVLFLLSLFSAIKNRQGYFSYLFGYVAAVLLAELCLLNLQWNWFEINTFHQVVAIALLFFLCHCFSTLSVADFIQKRSDFKRFVPIYTGLLALIGVVYFVLAWFVPYFHLALLIPAGLTMVVILVTLSWLAFKNKDSLSVAMLVTRLILSSLFAIAMGLYLDAHNIASLGHHAMLSVGMLDMVILLILFVLQHAQQQQKWQQQQLLQGKPKQNLEYLLRHNSQQMRTPINTIGQTLELLKEHTLDKKALSLIENIRIANQSLLNFSSELMHRITTDEQAESPQQTPFELPLLIEECLSTQQPILLDKNIEIISDIDEQISPIVLGHTFYLQKILNILLQNAIIHTQEGTVYLSVQALSESNDYLLFSVRDNGRGIDKQSLKALQQNNNDNPNSNSLQLVQLLLQQMHSQLNIQSKLGEGSEFSFQIHMPASKLTQPIANKDFSSLEGKQLLIIDDNQTFSQSLQQQISRWGLSVLASFDGIEAVAMFRAKQNLGEHFDFIILDNDTPGLSGIEVARRINQESQPHNKPRIILLASPLSMPNEHLCRHVGIDLRLHKPLSQRLLKNALFNLLQQPKSTTTVNKAVRLLVAEDNDISRRVISKMLQLLQIDSKVVSDGQLAVEACRRERFDLILMDCEMPVLDGFNASGEILAWQQKQHQIPTPIIALTAHVSDEQKQAAQKAGMTGFLEKPIKIEDLTQLIEQYL